MVEHQGEFFDPARHAQPPPVVPIRDGLQQPRPAPQQAPPQQPAHLFTRPIEQVTPQYVQMARAISTILATRVLVLIAVITASGVWSYTVYEPEQLRIIAASAFSLLGVAPLIWLYTKKG